MNAPFTKNQPQTEEEYAPDHPLVLLLKTEPVVEWTAYENRGGAGYLTASAA